MKLASTILLVLAWLTIGESVGFAHEVRPGYLELRETEPGVFSTLWKVPALGAFRLGIEPVYPPFCHALGEPITTLADNASIERGRMRCEQSLAGATIERRN